MSPGSSGPPQPPLRLTRRGVGRLAQLAVTAATLGAAAVSCGALDPRPRAARAASDATRPVSGTAGAAGPPQSTRPAAARGGATTDPSARPSARTPSVTAPSVTSPSATASTATAPPTPAPSATAPTATATTAGASGSAPGLAVSSVSSGLPGVGASWTSRLAGHDQVVLVSGGSMGSVQNVVTWFDRTAAGWVLRAQTPGWNGRGGWAVRHTVGDLRSPAGLYALTDAGGYARNPGTALPYDYDPGYYDTMVNGVRTFDHVLAINYNRVAGSPPSDSRRPGGWQQGGSIWVHVEHDSPTQACVGIADAALVALLRWLRPAANPVILMGPASILAG